MTLWNEALQWAAILVVALLGMGILYQVTDIQRRLGPDYGALMPSDGLAVGVMAPEIVAQDKRTGRQVDLATSDGRRLLVAFLSPTCRPCRELVPDLNRFARERRDTPVLVVELAGVGTDYAQELVERIIVVSDADGAIQQAYQVQRTPLIYLLDEERKVANRTVSNDFLNLEDTLAGSARPQGASAWVPAPLSPGDGDSEGSDVADARRA